MSYCRWSSDDYQCDIYAYEAEDGFVVHVASSRKRFTEPLPEPISPSQDFDGWFGDSGLSRPCWTRPQATP